MPGPTSLWLGCKSFSQQSYQSARKTARQRLIAEVRQFRAEYGDRDVPYTHPLSNKLRSLLSRLGKGKAGGWSKEELAQLAELGINVGNGSANDAATGP